LFFVVRRGLVAGGKPTTDDNKIEPLLNSATKDASKFAQIRSFWT